MDYTSMVKAQHLSCDYTSYDENDKEVVVGKVINDVSVDIPKGSFVVIAGRNGSGKTTMARHINALMSPTEGELTVGGFDASDESNIWNIRALAGMIFQNPDNQLIASVVEEDVAFGPENMGLPSGEIRARVDEALEVVDMSEYAKSNPDKLSGGQKQRVAIAGVLAMQTDCIVLDEPTAMLDPQGRKDVLRRIHQLNREKGLTIIYITHYLEEAVDADYIYVMDRGRMVMEGKPGEVLSRTEELRAHGLESTPMAELAARVLPDKNADVQALTLLEVEDALCR